MLRREAEIVGLKLLRGQKRRWEFFQIRTQDIFNLTSKRPFLMGTIVNWRQRCQLEDVLGLVFTCIPWVWSKGQNNYRITAQRFFDPGVQPTVSS